MLFDYFPWLIGTALVAIFWWQSLGARSRARRAALAACEDARMTFIDELAFDRIGLGRGFIKRRYRFEFYQRGDRRYGGIVEMNGLHVAQVQLEAHPFSQDSN